MVGHDDRGVAQVAQELEEGIRGAAVQVVGGLVQQEGLGRHGQHPGDGNALFPAQRERGDLLFPERQQARSVQDGAQAGFAGGGHAQGHLLRHRPAEELGLRILEHHAAEAPGAPTDAIPPLQAQGPPGMAAQRQGVHAAEVVAQGGFPGPGRAHEAHAFPAGQGDSDSVQDPGAAAAGLVDQARGPDHGPALSHCSAGCSRTRRQTATARPAPARWTRALPRSWRPR